MEWWPFFGKSHSCRKIYNFESYHFLAQFKVLIFISQFDQRQRDCDIANVLCLERYARYTFQCVHFFICGSHCLFS